MARALIGHTGFVGGNLKAQGAYDDFYNTSNIESIAGREYELIVSAGAPAAKWIANKDPVADLLAIQRLENALSQVQTRRFVLISTVDVYPRPFGVDESSEIDFASCEPYGRNRLLLEAFVTERFPRATILRLPGLFGPGLKKNLVFDLLNENRLDLVHQNGQFQFYDLANIGRDVQIYDDQNSGRSYKIGYISGVDICGLVFIGPLFWRPRAVTSTNSEKSR
jgi:nucleoside-diphosphate-sugar epimerase